MQIRSRIGVVAVALTVAVGGTFAAAGSAQAASTVATVVAYNAGQFCSGANEGKAVTADNGMQIQCHYVDGYRRWVVK